MNFSSWYSWFYIKSPQHCDIFSIHHPSPAETPRRWLSSDKVNEQGHATVQRSGPLKGRRLSSFSLKLHPGKNNFSQFFSTRLDVFSTGYCVRGIFLEFLSVTYHWTSFLNIMEWLCGQGQTTGCGENEAIRDKWCDSRPIFKFWIVYLDSDTRLGKLVFVYGTAPVFPYTALGCSMIKLLII